MSFKFSYFYVWNDVSVCTAPTRCECVGLQVEVRSNFKAKVRGFPDNGKHKWPLSPSNKTQLDLSWLPIKDNHHQ